MLNWNYLFAGIKQGLSNPHQLPAKVILIQMIGFSIKKKKIITNKCSSLLLHLYLHLLHFLIMNKSSYFTKKKSPIKIFNSLKKFKISKLKKKKNSKISIPSKNSSFKKKKKKSSLKSSLGTESYDPFLYSPMMQHQVNCPPLAFIEACNMS